MLDIFTPEQKASMLAQIMREESNGANLRDCCRAQGITVQTFIDWRARAQKHNQFDTLHLNGIHPERKPSKFRRDKPKTALQIALENAQRRTYPEDNPDDLHAVEHGEPPETPTLAAPAVVEPDIPAGAVEAASVPETTPEPDTKPVLSPTDEVLTVPKSNAVPVGKPRGVAAVMYERMPWLIGLDTKTEKAIGPKPTNKEPGYTKWVKHRKSLMTDEQRAEIDAFFSKNGSGKGNNTKDSGPKVAKRTPKPAQLEEQKEIAATRAQVTNGPRRVANKAPVSREVERLVAEHAEVSGKLAGYDAPAPRREVAEIERLKKALMILTLENMELRGLL